MACLSTGYGKSLINQLRQNLCQISDYLFSYQSGSKVVGPRLKVSHIVVVPLVRASPVKTRSMRWESTAPTPQQQDKSVTLYNKVP